MCFTLHLVPYWIYCDTQLEGPRKPIHIVGQGYELKTGNQCQTAIRLPK